MQKGDRFFTVRLSAAQRPEVVEFEVVDRPYDTRVMAIPVSGTADEVPAYFDMTGEDEGRLFDVVSPTHEEALAAFIGRMSLHIRSMAAEVER